jgi:hypothetical protein
MNCGTPSPQHQNSMPDIYQSDHRNACSADAAAPD